MILQKYFEKVKYQYIAYSILFLILLLQNPLQNYIPQLGILDELFPWLLMIISTIVIYIKYKKNFIIELFSLEGRKITIPLISLLIIGLASNIIYQYQSVIPIIADILTVFKGFITYLIVITLVRMNMIDIDKELILKIIKFLIILFFGLIMLNFIIPVFPTADFRYGIPSQRLFFTHPTYLATAASALLVILSLDTNNKNILYYLFITIVILSTQRSKAIMFIGVYYLLRYFIINKNKRLNLKIIIIVTVLGGLISYSKIIEYLSNPDWARTALMTNSALVAFNHFPLGSGFATFGTWYSGVYYSPLYSIYGLDQIWGLNSQDYSFLGDTYWPAIVGQFGFCGLVIVVYVIFQIYKNICKSDNQYNYFSKLALLVYLLILSTSETSFMSPVAVVLCIILAL